MSFIRNQAVTGFTFNLINKPTAAAIAGLASDIGKYFTKDGGTQVSISGAASGGLHATWSITVCA